MAQGMGFDFCPLASDPYLLVYYPVPARPRASECSLTGSGLDWDPLGPERPRC